MPRLLRIALLVLGFFFVPVGLRNAAAQEDILKEFREAPVISVLTFGPGDEAFLKFGHNAIRVQDRKRETDFVYNFGTFRFDSNTLILDFLTGKFKYWLSVQSFRGTLTAYKEANRTVTEQTLNLSPWSARDLNEALIENARPENAEYLYDYYRDNCSTRVRDAVDKVLKGELARRYNSRGQFTLRQHTLRAVADDYWLYLGLDVAMGAYIDQPETRYTEMFLPEKLKDALGGVVFSGVHGTNPLVGNTKVWYEAKGRPAPRRGPPERTWDFFKAGALFGGVLAFMGWESYKRRQRWAEIALPILLGMWGLLVGVLGSLFLGLWLFTNHEVSHRNENLLQCAPLALLFPVAAYGLLRLRPRWILWAQRAALFCLCASVLGLAFKLAPATFQQQNQRIIALCVPVWFGVYAACFFLLRKTQRIARLAVLPETSDATSAALSDVAASDVAASDVPASDVIASDHAVSDVVARDGEAPLESAPTEPKNS